ncbi:MAG TPA: HAMP domain-containing sensor histidine kinase [Ktedonobacterales bacterium]|jgi:signal transduction histidine kinase
MQVDSMMENTTEVNSPHPPEPPSDTSAATAYADASYASNRLEGEFLAIISHELRSPLAAIKGYAATLRRQGHRLGRAERDEFLQAIDEASDRLELLISRMMQLSRLEAGTLIPHPAPVDSVQLIREALAAAEYRWGSYPPLAPSHTYAFEMQSQAPMPPVLADLRLQREVLDIVLENTVKYSPGGGLVRVTLDTDGAMLTIGIRDQGIGISSDHLERIFDRFYRVDTRLTREVGGVGLGLAICKRIMALQGGDIWAESEPDVGSTFYMTLPLAKPNDEPQ